MRETETAVQNAAMMAADRNVLPIPAPEGKRNVGGDFGEDYIAFPVEDEGDMTELSDGEDGDVEMEDELTGVKEEEEEKEAEQGRKVME